MTAPIPPLPNKEFEVITCNYDSANAIMMTIMAKSSLRGRGLKDKDEDGYEDEGKDE